MDPNLLALYRALGVPSSAIQHPSGDQTPPRAGEAAFFEATQAQSDAPPAAARALGAPPLRSVRAADPPSADLPALDLAGVEALRQLNRDHPDEVLSRMRLVFDRNLTSEELTRALDSARAALLAPREAGAVLHAARSLDAATQLLPDTFEFNGMDLSEINIDPSNKKFEELGDAWGWIVNAGRFAFGYSPGPKAGFRYHDDPRYLSGFVYELEGQRAGAELSVALFADWGTGLYHSQYIAKQLRTAAYPYVIHLGDVYYAGRQEEFDNYFSRFLDRMLDTTRVFTMNGNHEMFSQGVPYFRYIDARRAHPLQKQEGSYFCLRGETAQIVAMDTDYFGYRSVRDPSLVAWLATQLQFGRDNGLTNILLTGDEPYEYGSTDLTDLMKDLSAIVVDQKLVDLWFWGNTHYCALFGPTTGLPFIGSCIGHGGFPYARQVPGKKSPAPVAFLETKGRFPDWTNLRPDRGNNGYCVLTFQADGALGIRYIDWMSHDRCLVSLPRSADGRLALGKVTAY